MAEPELNDVDAAVAAFGNPANRAAARVIGQPEAPNPDRAGQAIDIGRSLGVPPDVVLGDFDEFSRQHSDGEALKIIRRSPPIQSYIDRYPVATQVSADDWSGLERAGEAALAASGIRTVANIASGIADKLGESLQAEPADRKAADVAKSLKYFGVDEGASPNAALAVGAATGAASDVVQAGRQAMGFLTSVITGSVKGFSQSLHENLTELGRPFGIAPDRPEKIEREIGQFVEYLMMRGDLNPSTPFPKGSKPTQARQGMKQLDDALTAAMDSKTRERSPDAFEEFASSLTRGRSVGVSADAALELYRGQLPHPADGLLGWVPYIEGQLEYARATGLDIQIPMASLLARMDRSVYAKLRESIRTDPLGVTLAEAIRQGDEVPAQPQATPRGDLRVSAGLPAEPSPLQSLFKEKPKALPASETAALREAAEAEFDSRPAVRTDRMLRDYNVNVEDASRYAVEFGFKSPEEMASAITEHRAAIGEADPSAYRAREVDRMVTDALASEAALRHVTSDPVVAEAWHSLRELSAASGSAPPIDLPALRRNVHEAFARILAAEVLDPQVAIEAAGRHQADVSAALAANDIPAALAAKQRQVRALAAAAEIRAFRDDVNGMNALAAKLSKPAPGPGSEFRAHAQGLLAEAGFDVGAAREVPKEPIGDFVARANAEGWELRSPGEPKAFDEMTVAEVRALRDTARGLTHIGEMTELIDLGGKAADFSTFRAEVVGNIETLRPRATSGLRKLVGQWAYGFDAWLTKIEEMLKDLDLGKRGGPLARAVIEPMQRAKFEENSMLRELHEEMTKIRGFGKEWRKSLDEQVPNDFLIDPIDGTHFTLDRQDMIGIMLNWGTRESRDRFLRGYALPGGEVALEAKLNELFRNNATREDWDYVRRVWGLFERFRRAQDSLHQELSGATRSKELPLAIEAPDATLRGGEFPAIFDRLRKDFPPEGVEAAKGTFGPDYFPAIGDRAEGPIQFLGAVDQVAGRLQSIIHDVAFRRPIMEAKQVLLDPEIHGAITKHYGPEYAAQIDEWLKDIANSHSRDEVKHSVAERLMRKFRYNLVINALGLNLRVILSPSTGMFPLRGWSNFGPKAIAFAESHSREIKFTMENIDRDFREAMDKATRENKWDDFTAEAARFAYAPTAWIEKNFRVATFNREFKAAVNAGRSEAEAAGIADTAVREQHGSTTLTELPAVMRGGEFQKAFTMFYGFFNTMYNWQRQAVPQLRRGEYRRAIETTLGATVIPSLFGVALFNKSTESESWFETATKGLGLQVTSTIPFVREAANMFVEGNRPGSPLSSIINAAYAVFQEGKRLVERKPMKHPFKTAGNAVGLVLGLPMAQVSRTAQFTTDVLQNKQRPRNFTEWLRGIINGTARLPLK